MVLTTFSLIVISLFTLSIFGWMVFHIWVDGIPYLGGWYSIFGWMVFHITEGDKQFGILTGPVKFMSTFPDLFSQSVEEVKTLPNTFIPTPEDFNSLNRLESDLHVLSTYSDTGDSRSIVLLNLKNDSVLYKWTVENPYQEHDRIINPMLFPGKSLVYSIECLSGLRRIDSPGNVVWKQDRIHPQHGMTLDKEDNIWTCAFIPV